MAHSPQPDWSETCSAQTLEVLTCWGPIRHLKVWRDDGRDGITWDTLAAIKNELWGPDVAAVELYPTARDTVNEACMRHLWEIPPGHDLPFGLHPLQADPRD